MAIQQANATKPKRPVKNATNQATTPKSALPSASIAKTAKKNVGLYCKNCKEEVHSAVQKHLCQAHQKRAFILRTARDMNLPFGMVKSKLTMKDSSQQKTKPPPTPSNTMTPKNWTPAPEEQAPQRQTNHYAPVRNAQHQSPKQQPSRPQNTYANVTRPRQHTQPTVAEQQPAQPIHKCNEGWKEITRYLVITHLINSGPFNEQTKSILTRRAISTFLGPDIWKEANDEFQQILQVIKLPPNAGASDPEPARKDIPAEIVVQPAPLQSAAGPKPSNISPKSPSIKNTDSTKTTTHPVDLESMDTSFHSPEWSNQIEI